MIRFIILGVAALLPLQSANAAVSGPPAINIDMMAAGPSMAYSNCWLTTDVSTFGPAAQTTFDQIDQAFTLAAKTSNTTRTNAVKDIAIAITNASNRISAAIAGESMSDIQYELIRGKDILAMEMEYARIANRAEINDKNQGFFNDGNGVDPKIEIDQESDSWAYSKTLCSRTKIANKTSGAAARAEETATRTAAAKEAEMEQLTVIAENTVWTEIQQNHFNNYCGDNYLINGLCEEVNENTPLGDINAVNFLKPKGSDELTVTNDGVFVTYYTFNKDEMEASKDYIRNLLFYNPTKAPTPDELGRNMKPEFLAAYNRKYASLSLANYSFTNALKNREAIITNEAGIPLSKIDAIRYDVEQSMSGDALTSIESAKKKGVDIMLYSAMLTRNKIEAELLQQEERIELLLAAINAANINDPSSINMLNNLK